MLFIKPILLFLWSIFLPLLIGNIPIKMINRNKLIALSYIQGWLIMMAIFQLLVIPMIFLQTQFSLLVIIWSVIILLLGIISYIINWRIYINIIKDIWKGLTEIPWNMILAIILIILQTLLVVFFQHTDDDDAFYLGTAVTTLQNDSMYKINPYTGDMYTAFPARYVLSPFSVFIALIAKLTLLHPTIIAHTILPFFLIPIAYMIYYLIGKDLFDNDKSKVGGFLIIISILNLWGNFSVYTTSSFLLFRIWQGKAVLANIILPMVFVCVLRLSKESKKWCNWILMITLVFAGCMVSSMGIFLIPMSLGVYAIIMLIIKKDLKFFLKMISCCIPTVIYGLIYIYLYYKGVKL